MLSENTNPSLSRDHTCQEGLGSWPCTWASLKLSFSGRKVQWVWQRKQSAKLTDHPAWLGEMKSEWDSYLLVITGGSLFIPKWLNLNEHFWVKFRTFSVIWISKFFPQKISKGSTGMRRQLFIVLPQWLLVGLEQTQVLHCHHTSGTHGNNIVSRDIANYLFCLTTRAKTVKSQQKLKKSSFIWHQKGPRRLQGLL